MNVIVVGCGRMGSELAYRLYRRGDQVTVIDVVSSAFERLPADFRGRTLEGDVLSQDVLHRAGIAQAEAVAVMTPLDSVNAVVARVAREMYHIRHVAVRSYDPRQRAMLEAFDVPMVSPSSWGAQRIEELLSDAVVPAVFSPGNGEVAVYEFMVPPAWAGQALGELLLAGQSRPVALVRGGHTSLPDADTRVDTCDVVDVTATEQGIADLRRRFTQLSELAPC
jgi:trk system potassium uptake protein